MFEVARRISNSNFDHIFRVREIDDFAAERATYWAAIEWCREQFGPASSRRERPRWTYDSGGVIRIAHPDHAFTFKLRWC